MDESLTTLTISRLHELSPVFDEYGIGEDILFCEVRGSELEKGRELLRVFHYPFRFDGYLCCFCKNGYLHLDLNLRSYEVRSNTLFVNTPDNLMSCSLDPSFPVQDLELIAVFVSTKFVAGVHFDFSSPSQETARALRTPCITLNDAHLGIAMDYLNLALKVIHGPVSNRSAVIGSLISSFSYMTADIWKENVSAGEGVEHRPTRSNQIFERFIALVTEFHTTQRNMAFYADKLCLTPKYLSKLIRQVSGRSAPDWIDSFVILEAKNLLKYSGCSIKEIVYRLHFPNQSVFYKYFKAHSGMTPSEYRRQ